MGNWSISAQGITGDIERVEQIFKEIHAALHPAETGTGYTAFTHDGDTRTNFHLDPLPEATAPVETVPAGVSEEPAEGEASGGPEA